MIECGSEYVRAGFSGEPAPRVVVPMVAMLTPSTSAGGYQQSGSGANGSGSGEIMRFGWEAAKMSRLRELNSVFPRGSDSGSDTINGHAQIDWFGVVVPMLRHVIVDELGVEPAHHPLLLIEPAALTHNDREELLGELKKQRFCICMMLLLAWLELCS